MLVVVLFQRTVSIFHANVKQHACQQTTTKKKVERVFMPRLCITSGSMCGNKNVSVFSLTNQLLVTHFIGVDDKLRYVSLARGSRIRRVVAATICRGLRELARRQLLTSNVFQKTATGQQAALMSPFDAKLKTTNTKWSAIVVVDVKNSCAEKSTAVPAFSHSLLDYG